MLVIVYLRLCRQRWQPLSPARSRLVRKSDPATPRGQQRMAIVYPQKGGRGDAGLFFFIPLGVLLRRFSDTLHKPRVAASAAFRKDIYHFNRKLVVITEVEKV